MVSFGLNLFRHRLTDIQSTSRLLAECSFSHPNEHSPHDNSSRCIFSRCQQWLSLSTLRDRQQQRSHYHRQLAKYFVWVELFSQVFIQSETLGENVKLLHRAFSNFCYAAEG
jgi:hypothetical protein